MEKSNLRQNLAKLSIIYLAVFSYLQCGSENSIDTNHFSLTTKFITNNPNLEISTDKFYERQIWKPKSIISEIFTTGYYKPEPPKWKPNFIFNYNRELFGTSPTLWSHVISINYTTGTVTVEGGDSRSPTIPFSFSWGDETTSEGFFNQIHTYSDISKNYYVSVTAHYSDSTSDSEKLLVRFVKPEITPIPFPASLAVTIPNQLTSLGTRQSNYTPPNLTFFDDTFFSNINTRSNAEYVFSQAAKVEDEILESDHELVAADFHQVVLRDPNAGGAYSLWYSTPVAFGSGDDLFTGAIGYSSIFHEMGHNFTLNSPANYRYGGKIDGNANAIFSETIAQIFQHTVAYELVNNLGSYGIPPDLAFEIASSAKNSMKIVRNAFDNYIAQGKPFSTWNDPETPADETFDTFMTVAYQFFSHAESIQSYKQPLIRTMQLLRTFNSAMLEQYSPNSNTITGSTFRSTLMVAAISYGFSQDLRDEFRQLGFLIDDSIFTALFSFDEERNKIQTHLLDQIQGSHKIQ